MTHVNLQCFSWGKMDWLETPMRLRPNNLSQISTQTHLHIDRGWNCCRMLVALPAMLVTHRKAMWLFLRSSSMWSRAHQQRDVREEYEHCLRTNGCALLTQEKNLVTYTKMNNMWRDREDTARTLEEIIWYAVVVSAIWILSFPSFPVISRHLISAIKIKT